MKTADTVGTRMIDRRIARFVGGRADGMAFVVGDLPRLLSLALNETDVESYRLDRTEVIDQVEIGTYSAF